MLRAVRLSQPRFESDMAPASARAKGVSMRRPTILLALILVALLYGTAATSLLVGTPPEAADPPGNAEFDEVRAQARLAAILGDQRPHPADSTANDQVRARIVAQLEQIGLKP